MLRSLSPLLSAHATLAPVVGIHRASVEFSGCASTRLAEITLSRIHYGAVRYSRR